MKKYTYGITFVERKIPSFQRLQGYIRPLESVKPAKLFASTSLLLLHVIQIEHYYLSKQMEKDFNDQLIMSYLFVKFERTTLSSSIMHKNIALHTIGLIYFY